MKAKVTSKYIIEAENTVTQDIDLTDFLLDAKKKCPRSFTNRKDLKSVIREIVEDTPYPKESVSEEVSYWGSQNIENIKELVEHYKYLITEQTCCDQQSRSNNYCSECGKKLK